MTDATARAAAFNAFFEEIEAERANQPVLAEKIPIPVKVRQRRHQARIWERANQPVAAKEARAPSTKSVGKKPPDRVKATEARARGLNVHGLRHATDHCAAMLAPMLVKEWWPNFKSHQRRMLNLAYGRAKVFRNAPPLGGWR